MRKTVLSLWVIAATLMAAGVMVLTGAASAEQAVHVRVARVTLGNVEQTVALRGIVGYEGAYAALAPATGVVAQVYVQPGDAVTAGQALFRMDDTQEVAALSMAWAAGEELTALAGATQAAEQAQRRLAALTVRAQTDGLVQQVQVKQHGGVTMGMPAVVLSGSGQEILCPAVVKDAEAVQPGMRARILFGGSKVCMGTVERVGPALAEETTGQVLCQVTIRPEDPLSLPVGAAVEAEIICAAAEGVAVLPVTALTAEGSVWWLAEGRAWETAVTVPLQDEAWGWVSLPVGATVVDRPWELVHGQRVQEVVQ